MLYLYVWTETSIQASILPTTAYLGARTWDLPGHSLVTLISFYTLHAHTVHPRWAYKILTPMPPKKNKQKGLPLRDGDASGNLGKPPDNPGPAQEPELRRESTLSRPTRSRHHENDDDTSNARAQKLQKQTRRAQKCPRWTNRLRLHCIKDVKSVPLNRTSKMTREIACDMNSWAAT